jgi:hypothetical protein
MHLRIQMSEFRYPNNYLAVQCKNQPAFIWQLVPGINPLRFQSTRA